MSSSPVVERVASLIEPQARVLYMAGTSFEPIVGRLNAQQCSVTTLTALDQLPSAGIFDVAVVSDTSCGSDDLPSITGSMGPLLTGGGYVVMIISNCSNGSRDILDDLPQTAGFLVGYSDVVEVPRLEGTASSLVALAFPLPALAITIFRARIDALQRRRKTAEHQARLLLRKVSELTPRRLGEIDETSRALRERAQEQRRLIDTLKGQIQRYRSDSARQQTVLQRLNDLVEAQRAGVAHNAAQIYSTSARLAALKRAGDDATAIDAVFSSLQQEQRSIDREMCAIRTSFSWRLTAPLRRIVRRLGATTVDESQGWGNQS